MTNTRKIYIASGIVSICGIVFQVMLGALGSYTLGDSVKQYALTIGLFLSGMGIGSALSEKVMKQLIRRFVQIELLIGVIGGCSSFVLFFILAYGDFTAGQFYLYLVTLIIGMLTGLEVPILIRRASEIGVELNKSTARVLFSDYAGSLVGALAFVFLLRPWLGLIKTAFLIGMINIAVAIWLIYAFRNEMVNSKWLKGLNMALFLLLFAGFWFGESYVSIFEQKLYRDQIVRSFDTSYQRVVVTKEGPDTRLYLNGNIQFSSSDEHRYHEALVHPAMSAAKAHQHILILGGGDGIVMRELLKYDDVGQVTMVDLDEEFVQFAKEDPLLTAVHEGSLQSDKLRIIHEDAFQFMMQDRSLYDVIIVDLPDPNSEALNKLYTLQFYNMVQKRLAPDGAAAIQSTSPLHAVKAFWTIHTTIKEAGLHAQSYHVEVPSFGNWGFTLATRNPLDINHLQVEVDTKYLNNEVLPLLFSFGEDEDEYIEENGSVLKLRPNTINDPILMQYYNEAWKFY
ncbi:polyamine aminopropyltransferase [Longirhabdus pacifica]|uniref:polyamine aminopropyltransferase n=1 Tax=Longirhabdus pacifica TaxID=2305227 RepID=UPI00100910A4|nr:polyamine aminopropyltransferase [Longirhabdus pacifica]